MQTELQKVVDQWPDWSCGKTEASFAFTPTLVLSQTEAWYAANGAEDKRMADARALAAAYLDAGSTHPYDTANFDFDAIIFSSGLIGNYCGLGLVGGKGTWIKCHSAGVMLHEWGHNLGLWHANFWQAGTDSPSNDVAAHAASTYGNFAVSQTATTVNLTWTPFAPIVVWRNLQFGANAGNAAISGDFVDVEKDSLVNLMEYALGLNPNVFNAGGVPHGVIKGTYLTVTYTRAKGATDITLRAVWAAGLSGWSATGITEDILSDDGVIQTVKAKALIAPDTKKFLRLEVTRP